jgi:hypothetical protein
MRYRVAQWGTGNVGRLALSAIIDHPELELVGLVVHTPAKAGKDAGELCGRDPVGVVATTDPAEVLALKPDCVSYNAGGDLRPLEAVDDICRVLEAGSNVVSTSVVSLLHRRSADPAVVERIEAACAAGGTSCFTSGIDPGFANEVVPMVLTGACERVDFIRVMEILNYASYDQPELLFEMMGFGKPPEHVPPLLIPGVLTSLGSGPLYGIAEALGVELDEVREVSDRWNAETDIETKGGLIATGTMAAMRFELQGLVDGEPVVAVGHVNRMDDAAAPEWPQPVGKGSYRITVDGSPSIKCELEFVGEDGDHNTGGLLVTAMRTLHAIPAVCAAPSGMLGANDVGLVTGRHTHR